MSNKIWLSMHPRNFSSQKICLFIRPTIHVSVCKMSHLQAVFHLIWDIHVMVNIIDSCNKVLADQYHITASQAQVYNSPR